MLIDPNGVLVEQVLTVLQEVPSVQQELLALPVVPSVQ
jgi:hypothetical protein